MLLLQRGLALQLIDYQVGVLCLAGFAAHFLLWWPGAMLYGIGNYLDCGFMNCCGGSME